MALYRSNSGLSSSSSCPVSSSTDRDDSDLDSEHGVELSEASVDGPAPSRRVPREVSPSFEAIIGGFVDKSDSGSGAGSIEWYGLAWSHCVYALSPCSKRHRTAGTAI